CSHRTIAAVDGPPLQRIPWIWCGPEGPFCKDSNSMGKVSSRWLLSVLVLVIPLGGFIAYKVSPCRPAYLLAKGNKAVENGDFQEVGRLAEELDNEGHSQAAHLLRGKGFLYAAEAVEGSEQPSTFGAPSPYLRFLRHALDEFEQVQGDGPLGSEGAVLGA